MDTSRDDNSQQSTMRIASIANSVTTLAKAVSDLQNQIKKMDQRLSEQESASYMDGNASTGRHKKAEFLKAYKAVISIMRALKVMPEIKEYQEEESDSIKRDRGLDGDSNMNGTPARDKNASSTHAQLLRSIAATLSDIETVASYVSQDDVSTAEASTLSRPRPADYVNIKTEGNNINTLNNADGMADSKAIDALKQMMEAKDDKMLKLMEEARLQTELLQKKNNRWGLTNLASILLLFGGVYIGNSYDFHQNIVQVNRFVRDSVEDGTQVNDTIASMVTDAVPQAHIDSEIAPVIKHEHRLLEVEPLDKVEESPQLSENETSIVEDMDIASDDDEHDNTTVVPDLDVLAPQEESKQSSDIEIGENDAVDSPVPIVEQEKNGATNDATMTQKSDNENVVKRGWVEANLCDELDGMMMCKNGKNKGRSIENMDNKSIHRVMIRRQILTALGVVVAMTLPKLAPHIFKINIAQVLSFGFWKSLMEFATVMIQ